MAFQYWHLAVVAALVVLIAVGLRGARRVTQIGLGVTLLAASGFLLYTLVLEEEYLDQDLNGRLDDVALIGGPALLGVGLLLLAVRSARRSRA